jgi:ParB-like chromosome segregation protein Spo0J
MKAQAALQTAHEGAKGKVKKMADVTQATSAQTNGTNTKSATEDKVEHIPLSDIEVDWAWNSRSYANVVSEHSESDNEAQGITGLTKGIFLDGQNEPVVVRPSAGVGNGKIKKPYCLVAGFRRFEAIRRLNNPKISTEKEPGEISEEFGKLIAERKAAKKSVVPNSADGTVRAVVRTMSESEARILNLTENTNRDSLTAPDLMHAIKDLKTKHDLTDTQIADHLGKSQGHISMLGRIAKCNKEILDHWRNGGEFEGLPSNLRATVRELDDLSKVEPKEQNAEYKRILQAKIPAGDDKDGTQWVLSAKKKAQKLGELLGSLQKLEFLKVAPKAENAWHEWIDVMVKNGKKDLTTRQAKSVAKAAEEAYFEALNREEEAEEEETEATA